MYHFAYIISVC